MRFDVPQAWPRPNIALVGFMGAGKTAVGKRLAETLGAVFLDVDEIVEKLEGISVAQIFRERGEARFRQREHEVLRAACAGEGAVIGCGGGTVLDPRNRRLLEERCFTIWLKTSLATLTERLRETGHPRRPLLPAVGWEAVVRDLLEKREPFYQLADATVSTDGLAVDEVVARIVDLLARGRERD
jgi:shikimate kinase